LLKKGVLNMSNKNVKNWALLIEEKKDEIVEKIQQAIRSTEGTMSGWHVDIEMDHNEVWVTGLMSCGCRSMDAYNGKTVIIHSVKSWKVEFDVMEVLKNHDVLYNEFLSQKEDDYEYAHDFMKNNHSDLYDEWFNEYIDEEICNYDYDYYIDLAIEHAKNNYEEHLIDCENRRRYEEE
jgi:hypothetical protein